jgi:pyridoxamine 5'-phosphate oxidase
MPGVQGELFIAPSWDGAFAEPLPADPIPLLARWLEEAKGAQAAPNPDAMVLATVDAAGEPCARVVLCKGVDIEAGYLVFYTNYQSAKAEQLAECSAAAATFHWDHAGRQARVRGRVEQLGETESDAYFASRPLLSKLGAWASDQSRPMQNREEVVMRVLEAAERFGVDLEALIRGDWDGEIPRPRHWGGYRLWAGEVELWAGGVGRLHERARWKRELASGEEGWSGGEWRSERLQP